MRLGTAEPNPSWERAPPQTRDAIYAEALDVEY